VLGVTPAALPGRMPYLAAPAPQEQLITPPGTIRVGLVWTGNPLHQDDARRSITLGQLTPVLRLPGIRFYSLQRPIPERDRDEFAALTEVVDLGSRCADFYDTASYLAQMDCLLSVDTAAAHLAGAMGKRVWTMLPHAADWRWLLERTDSVWYPSMRLYRQTVRNEWSTVIDRVARDLAELANGGRHVSGV